MSWTPSVKRFSSIVFSFFEILSILKKGRKKIYDWTEKKHVEEEHVIESRFCDASKMIESFFSNGDVGEHKRRDDINDIKLTKYQMFILTGFENILFYEKRRDIK